MLFKSGYPCPGEKLILANACCCFLYAIFYLLLVLPFNGAGDNKSISIVTLLTLKLLCVLVHVLTICTLCVLYNLMDNYSSVFRAVYIGALIAGFMITIKASCILALSFTAGVQSANSEPKFMQPFRCGHQLVYLLFSITTGLLIRKYYQQLNMRLVVYYIIPVIILFAFREWLPSLLFMATWLLFGGCFLLLYYSIIDARHWAVADKDWLMDNPDYR